MNHLFQSKESLASDSLRQQNNNTGDAQSFVIELCADNEHVLKLYSGMSVCA